MTDIYENKLDKCALTFDEYKKEYTKSIQHPEEFWSEKAKTLDWMTPFKKVIDESFNDNAFIRWFDGGSLNPWIFTDPVFDLSHPLGHTWRLIRACLCGSRAEWATSDLSLVLCCPFSRDAALALSAATRHCPAR